MFPFSLLPLSRHFTVWNWRGKKKRGIVHWNAALAIFVPLWGRLISAHTMEPISVPIQILKTAPCIRTHQWRNLFVVFLLLPLQFFLCVGLERKTGNRQTTSNPWTAHWRSISYTFLFFSRRECLIRIFSSPTNQRSISFISSTNDWSSHRNGHRVVQELPRLRRGAREASFA